MGPYDYDMLVIGSGPAGQRAAIQAAKAGKRVAIAERRTVVGGVCINTGTIPSKTLREAALHLSGYRERGLYGASYKVKDEITMEDLLFRAQHVIQHEIDVIRHQLQRNDVALLAAEASFLDEHRLRLRPADGGSQWEASAAHIVIAVGTRPTRPPNIPFDGTRVFASDDVLELDRIPRTLAVVGGGVIGLEYASIFAALGVRVTVIDARQRLLPFIDEEIIDALIYHLRQYRVTFRLGETVTAIEPADNAGQPHVRLLLESGKQVTADKALHCIGRTGATNRLELERAGLAADERGRLQVNEHYQTQVDHIYAVGDVIGFPSLAATSMEQGRLAACHAFGIEAESVKALFPYGVYTIPEISTVGRNEEELTDEAIPYEVGKAQYREIARGQIIGDEIGLLKLLFHRENHRLLGIHIIGEGASELVHIGQSVLSFGGPIDYFINTVFNYPTLAECYKTAAFDGINRLNP
ncbi:MAG TPA: Si-specific NAD(P)(+) transhydrogenase [Anaerolineales bacterium]|jgi:NAD(P) transhydrogenase